MSMEDFVKDFAELVDCFVVCLLLRNMAHYLIHLVLHHLKIDLFFCFFYILI